MSFLRPTDAVELDGLTVYLERRTGLSFGGSQRPRLLNAVQECMHDAGLTEPTAYQHLLDADEEAFDDLVDALTVGESYFFRDRRQLDLLTEVVIPDLLDGRRSRELSAWSVGCAAGQEPFTVAMLLEDHPIVGHYRVLGSDLSAAAISRAERATYGRWALRGVDEDAQHRYFERRRGRFHVRERYRRQVSFERANLHDGDRGRQRFDIVLCRNVLIYLTADGIERAAATLRDALTPGGWLILGSSDPPLDADGLVRVRTPRGLAYRHMAAVPHRADAQTRVAPARPDLRQAQPAGRTKSRPTAPLPIARRSPGAPSISVPQRAVTADDRLDRARHASENGDPDTAAELARELIEEGPADPEVHGLLVQSLGDRGHVADAAAAADAAIARHPDDARLRYLSAVILLAAGLPDDAAAALEASVDLDPDLVAGHLLLSRVEHQLGRRRAAERRLERVRQLLETMAPDDAVPLTNDSAGFVLTSIAPPVTGGAAR